MCIILYYRHSILRCVLYIDCYYNVKVRREEQPIKVCTSGEQVHDVSQPFQLSYGLRRVLFYFRSRANVGCVYWRNSLLAKFSPASRVIRSHKLGVRARRLNSWTDWNIKA